MYTENQPSPQSATHFQEIFAYRRRAMRKAELAAYLREAGFREVAFLPQPSPWHPYEVVASL